MNKALLKAELGAILIVLLLGYGCYKVAQKDNVCTKDICEKLSNSAKPICCTIGYY